MESPLTQFLNNPTDFEASFDLRNPSAQFNENDKFYYLSDDIYIELRFKSKHVFIEQTGQELHDKKLSEISLRLPNKGVVIDKTDLTDRRRESVIEGFDVEGYLNPGDLLYTGTILKFDYGSPDIHWDAYYKVINTYKHLRQNCVLNVKFDVKVTVMDN